MGRTVRVQVGEQSEAKVLVRTEVFVRRVLVCYLQHTRSPGRNSWIVLLLLYVSQLSHN